MLNNTFYRRDPTIRKLVIFLKSKLVRRMVYRDIYDFKEINETTADEVGTSKFSFLVHNLDT